MMKFYDKLQLDPKELKKLIKDSSSSKEKIELISAMVLRSILLVLFAIVFISTLSTIFGSENSPMAVVIFCILLAIRFVDFGYCIKDELIILSIVFLILLISPTIAFSVCPLLGFFINLVSFFTILLITCDKPEMGNGGLFSFAYIYLCGNTVYGEAFIQRCYLTLICLILCGIVFYIKHKDKNKEIRFIEKNKNTNFKDFKYHWMIRMAIGISTMLLVGVIFEIERFMWAGFACGSLLSVYSTSSKIKERFMQRLIGAIAGVIVFLLIYNLLPKDLHSMIGPLGGFCLGFCVDYKYKTALNCLGALFIACGIYGLEHSLFLRVSDTIIGLLFGFLFIYIYERFVLKNKSFI